MGDKYIASVLKHETNTPHAIITIIAYILYKHIYLRIKHLPTINSKHRINWVEQNRIICSNQTLTLSGVCSGTGSLHVTMDDKLLDVLRSNKGFQVEINLSQVECGWHKITASIIDENTSLYVHKISNKEGFIINEHTVTLAKEEKEKRKSNYAEYMLDNYNPRGRYFNSFDENTQPSRPHNQDENGVILLPKPYSLRRRYYYNPVTIAQKALEYYCESESSENRPMFLKYAEWLVQNQSSDGSYKYDILWFCGPIPLFPGWVSGMAQGQVLSVLSRAYNLTNDEKYLEAGLKALTFLSRHVDEGGCTCNLNDFANLSDSLYTLTDKTIVEEYPTQNPPLVLNGNLFTLIGLYDWSKISSEKFGKIIAEELFQMGCNTIASLLPYYDYYTYSSYSLQQWMCNIRPNFESTYAHDCHIYLLHSLYNITGIEIFEQYYKRFLKYVS